MALCENCGECESCGNTGNTQSDSYHSHKHLEHGFKKFWRPIAAYVYLGICIFDFVVGPIWLEQSNQSVNVVAFAEIRKFEDKDVQMRALDNVELGNRTWTPLTLLGGGLFHLAFGGILGISAFTRGREKVAAINNAPRLRDL